jgi:hypothetical protein
MANEELDDQSLFDAAVSDEPAETLVADVAEVPEKPEAEQTRDETGKFAKAEEPEKPAVTAEKSAVDDNAPQVPSWRVREINDEKRALAERLTALETERNQWLAERQRLAAAQDKPAPKVEAVKPDPLLDPEGYEKYLETKFEERLLNDRREASLANAHKTYKGEFEEAYATAQKQTDPAQISALKARMQQSRDPGETLMEWHRERKTQAEIGGDLNAYKAKLREEARQEALKDVEFRKAAIAAWRDEAPTQSNGRPRVDLPPSLNGASRSNALLRSEDGDVSDHELFAQTTG